MAAQDPEVQKIAYSIQFLEDQANLLGQQQEYFTETLSGLKMTLNTLKELEVLPENNEIILPIGNRAFIQAVVPDPTKVLLAISKNVIMEKTIPDAQAYTQKAIDELTETQKQLQEQLQKIGPQLDQLKAELNRRLGGASAPQVESEGSPSDF
jgi:prefoldin alpha subunit